MTSDTHDPGALGSYVLDGLDEEQRRSVEDHLAGCARCRQERVGLEAVTAMLGELPPEALLDGPPEDGELLLQRTLRQVRRESTRTSWRRRAALGAAAGLLVLTALAGGMALGRGQQQPPLAAAPPAAPSAPAPTAGTVVGSGTDPATGARLTVRVVPATGWVRVQAAVNGIAEGEECRLWVVARDGSREPAGSWLVSATGAQEGTTVDGTALVAPPDVAAVEVTDFAGHPFVAVPL